MSPPQPTIRFLLLEGRNRVAGDGAHQDVAAYVEDAAVADIRSVEGFRVADVHDMSLSSGARISLRALGN